VKYVAYENIYGLKQITIVAHPHSEGQLLQQQLDVGMLATSELPIAVSLKN